MNYQDAKETLRLILKHVPHSKALRDEAIREVLAEVERLGAERDGWKRCVADEVGENLKLFDEAGITVELEAGEQCSSTLVLREFKRLKQQVERLRALHDDHCSMGCNLAQPEAAPEHRRIIYGPYVCACGSGHWPCEGAPTGSPYDLNEVARISPKEER